MKTSVKYFRRDELINGLVNAQKINKNKDICEPNISTLLWNH